MCFDVRLFAHSVYVVKSYVETTHLEADVVFLVIRKFQVFAKKHTNIYNYQNPVVALT